MAVIEVDYQCGTASLTESTIEGNAAGAQRSLRSLIAINLFFIL